MVMWGASKGIPIRNDQNLRGILSKFKVRIRKIKRNLKENLKKVWKVAGENLWSKFKENFRETLGKLKVSTRAIGRNLKENL